MILEEKQDVFFDDHKCKLCGQILVKKEFEDPKQLKFIFGDKDE